MRLRPGRFVPRSGALAALALLAAVGSAWPQAQPQPPAPAVQPPPEPAQQPAAENPGLLHEMGKLIDRITPSTKDAVKDAGDALSRLAKPGSMVSGRTICPAGAGGTPDCKAAADRLCQSKGYKEGNSLNTDSAQTCSAKVLIPGRTRKPDDCRTDNFVTTALCQ